MAFSPDGKRIVTASGGVYDAQKRQSVSGVVKVWDVATGQVTLTLTGHRDTVEGVAFSPDGKWIASGSRDNTLKVWDAATGQVTLTLKGHTDGVNSLAFSPDGKRIVSGGISDPTLKVWDAATGQVTLTLTGHAQGLNSVAFSPDGKRIASGSWDRTVKLWDAQTGQEILTLKDHTDKVTRVCFSPDGKRLASASYDKTVKVWAVKDSQLISQTSAASPGGTQTFAKPTANGYRVDRCLFWAQQCDEPAASAWCRTQGYSRATNWQSENASPTRILGDGKICNTPSCGGFSSITCSK